MRNNIDISKLIGLGLDPKYKGFTYMLDVLYNTTKLELFGSPLERTLGSVGRHFNVSSISVRNSLIKLISTAWLDESAKLHTLFSRDPEYPDAEKPTVTEFLYMMVYYVELGDTNPIL